VNNEQAVIDLEPIYRHSAVLRALRPVISLVCGHLLKFDRFAADMRTWETMCEGRDTPFAPAVEGLQLKIKVDNREALGEFEQGPLIVASNHPFGALEGIAIGHLFDDTRYHLKIFATEMLHRIVPMRSRLICADSLTRKDRAGVSNFRALRTTMKHLQGDGALLMFPAGRVSHFRWKYFKVADPDWTTQVVRLARRRSANVLLIHVEGANSWRYQLAGFFHPLFRTLLLLREFYRRAEKKSVRLTLKAIPHDAPVLIEGSEESAIAALRKLTYGMHP
jgi:putative hemolysin